MKMKIFVGVFIFGILLNGFVCEPGYFWHVTDHHYDTTYWTDMRSCNMKVSKPGIYGDEWCDPPWRLVNDSIFQMAKIKASVDFLLWTGDNVAHIEKKFTSVESNMAIIYNITDALKAAFPNVKVYATMGNHDWHPADQYPGHNAKMYNLTAELWRDWIDDKDQLNNFRKAAYYTVKTRYGLRIVGLNSILYYKPNHQTPNYTDPGEQFQWLQGVLKMAKQNKEKVLLTTHIPPGLKVPGNVQWFYDIFNTRLLDILKAHSDVISGYHCGHNHADDYKLVVKDGGPVVPIFTAPSVTPWRYKSGDESDYPHNPAVRLVKYDRQLGTVLNIEQYYTDLTQSNKDNATHWKLAYSAVDDYNLQDLSAVSVDNLVKKLDKNKNYLDKYIRYTSVLANGNRSVNECTDTCRAEYICAMTHLKTDSFKSCISAKVSVATAIGLCPVLSFLTFIITSLLISL